MIDTHAHLYDAAFEEDRKAVIARAKAAGVTRVYLPNCDSATLGPMLRLAEEYPGYCLPMVGLHPCYVKENYRDELTCLEKSLQEEHYYAVGEIGLDYYWDTTFASLQQKAFKTQMEWAKAHRMPVVIHSRESTADCIRHVRDAQDGSLRGVFHCFSGTEPEAEEIVELGFMLGIGGVVTYKNAAALHSVVRKVDLQHLVLETDAPYLAPVPHRGKRNETSYLPSIAGRVAELKGIPVHEVITVTTGNALRLFAQD